MTDRVVVTGVGAYSPIGNDWAEVEANLRVRSTGVAYGSCTGSTAAGKAFAKMLLHKSLDGITAMTYIRMMAHTTAVNISVFFGLKGRVITTSSACTSGSQGIGYAFGGINTSLIFRRHDG